MRWYAGLYWLALGASVASGQTYHVARRTVLGGDGGWDLLALDTAGQRLFVARQNRVMVIDPADGRLLGEIPGFDRAHGIAFAYAAGHGFATSGGDSTVVMFDLTTLAVVARIKVDLDADGILYEPVTKRIFSINGDAQTASAIDPVSGRRIGTVALGAKPEFAVADGEGHLYVNLEDQGAIAELDAAALTVMRRWSLAPCASPTGLALDRAHHILFSGCRSGVMAISNASSGALLTTVPIGAGVDGCRFDSATGLAFASNGDGTLTVVRAVAADRFEVAATVPTEPGARTLELDQRTHRIFTVTAELGPAPLAAPDHPHPRRPVVPGTFALLELDP